jgi:toxin ParE1/3/4
MRLRFSSFVKYDLAEIAEYISHDSPREALKLVRRIRESFKHIAENPQLYRVRTEIAPQARVMPVGNYVILFRQLRDFVRVERVVHGSRDLSNLPIGDRE